MLSHPPADLLDQLSPAGNYGSVPGKLPVQAFHQDLLRHRPDIREAEAQLHAATAQIGVAVAQLFPQFSLTGSAELE